MSSRRTQPNDVTTVSYTHLDVYKRQALAVTTKLLIDLCGARVLPGTIDVGGPGPDAPQLTLQPDRVNRLLGSEIPSERCEEILAALGFDVLEVDGALRVHVPHFRRRDVTREVDLIEEVARICLLYTSRARRADPRSSG